jgi:protocatechuate 3,4-dioxygenase beta subunit
MSATATDRQTAFARRPEATGSAATDGYYDIQDRSQPEMNLRGLFTTGVDGRYFFRSVKPSSYSIPTTVQ